MTDGRIYLKPIGDQDVRVLDGIAEGVAVAFGLPVSKLPAVEVPEHAFNSLRGQYHSTQILRGLLPHAPDDALRLLAVSDVDLFVPHLNFVFGEATLDGRVAIISLYRLHPEFYGGPTDEEIFLGRAVKEAVHELGHTFGLKHCRDPGCVMYFSNSIGDTDRKSAEFCKKSAGELGRKLQVVRAAS